MRVGLHRFFCILLKKNSFYCINMAMISLEYNAIRNTKWQYVWNRRRNINETQKSKNRYYQDNKKKPWYSTTRSKIAPIIKVVSCIITSGSIITRILMRNYCMVNPYTKRTCAHIQPKNNRHKNDWWK